MIVNMVAAFRELKATDTTILLVEQNFMVAKSLGDTVAVMDDGRVVHCRPDGGTGRRPATCSTASLGLSLDQHQ